MRRRFLPSIYDHNGREGAYATEWEGWLAVNRITVNITRRINRTPAPEVRHRVNDQMGCYAILHETENTSYVLYVGFSRILQSELVKRLNEADLLEDTSTTFAVVYIPNFDQATHYEDELIRYYAPPWNTKFHKQG
jgi:hypothetical protein